MADLLAAARAMCPHCQAGTPLYRTPEYAESIVPHQPHMERGIDFDRWHHKDGRPARHQGGRTVPAEPPTVVVRTLVKWHYRHGTRDEREATGFRFRDNCLAGPIHELRPWEGA